MSVEEESKNVLPDDLRAFENQQALARKDKTIPRSNNGLATIEDEGPLDQEEDDKPFEQLLRDSLHERMQNEERMSTILLKMANPENDQNHGQDPPELKLEAPNND